MLLVEHLSKQFGSLRAVQDVSFQLEPGEVYGLLGPNGAGKSTTIGMIATLLRPDAGSITIGGIQLDKAPGRAKQLMGVVPQELAIYEELSALENLRFWGELAGLSSSVAKSRSVEILKSLALDGRGKEPVNKFSGGMKRRVNIGCSLMHRPKLLLLDEPTVGIDPQARSNILEFVRNLAREGTTILYTTHYLEEAEHLCDRIGIIDGGKLLAEGSLSELQGRISKDRIVLIDGNFEGVNPSEWSGFDTHFRVIQKSNRQLAVTSILERDPGDCLRDLLQMPLQADNVTIKRPSLNDVFLQLTGRELRE